MDPLQSVVYLIRRAKDVLTANSVIRGVAEEELIEDTLGVSRTLFLNHSS